MAYQDTRVLTCNCVHEFQDQRYGKGRRVMNQMSPKSNSKNFRCTSCGATRGEGHK